jgi:16S rRNA (adenine1518-N6/adenine1519-N6)-dimethyltransferase
VSRRLGQHFLADPAILDRIVDALDPATNDLIIEIGPGKGTLTRRLAPRVGRVIAIEKDERLAEETRAQNEEMGIHNVEVVTGDALALPWAGLVERTTDFRSAFEFKVVGNIPYYITSPLIEQALTPPVPSRIVFLVQREFADRVAAVPGGKEYGALSVGVQAVARVERLFTVRAGSFTPPPRVDSAVVRVVPLAQSALAPHEQGRFRRFLAAIFSQRRKQLGRGLRESLGLMKPQAEEVLRSLGVDPSLRAEVLTVEQLVEVFRITESLIAKEAGA